MSGQVFDLGDKHAYAATVTLHVLALRNPLIVLIRRKEMEKSVRIQGVCLCSGIQLDAEYACFIAGLINRQKTLLQTGVFV